MQQKNNDSLLSKLKCLDAYPKINEDFFTKTLSGGIITIISVFVMALLFFNEVRLHLTTNTLHELSVDTSRGEQIEINFDVSFSKMPCSYLSLDAMDISGDVHLEVDHDIYKQRLSATGKPLSDAMKHSLASTKASPPAAVNTTTNVTCGSCYGAEDKPGDCCNTCDEVRNAYRRRGWALSTHVPQCEHDAYYEAIREQRGEGCRMWGQLLVNKVAGNFHFAAGRSYQQGSMHVHDMAPFADVTLDFSHRINHLSFGSTFPGATHQLDGSEASATPDKTKTYGMFQYFLKVVPTEYAPLSGAPTHSNQFSVTQNFREGQGSGYSLPGLFFFYDLSPIKVRIVQQRANALHFLTNVCAIVGGAFTVAGLVDAAIYQGERIIRRKMEIGKFS